MGEARGLGGSKGRAAEPEVVALDELLRTLTSQKEALRRAHEKEDAAHARKLRKQLHGRNSSSSSNIIVKSQSVPVMQLEKSSSMPNSASFSFGKLRHRKGKYGILVCEPRDADYQDARLGDNYNIPGVGHYRHPRTDGHEWRATEAFGGSTGDWTAHEHEVFLQTLAESDDREASRDFFTILTQRLPYMPHWRQCDHVRWYAQWERQDHQKQRRVVRWRQEHTRGLDPAYISEAEMHERAAEARRVERLCHQAGEEEARWSRPKDAATKMQQRNCDGEVLDDNLRGHLQFRKSAGYTFGASRQPLDTWARRFTSSSQVRSSSHLDNPGPGHYLGLDEKIGQMKQMPRYTFAMKFSPEAVDQPVVTAGPGYMGELRGTGWEHAGVRLQEDLRQIQVKKPAWSFGNEEQRFQGASSASQALTDQGTPNNVGPGSHLGRGTYVAA